MSKQLAAEILHFVTPLSLNDFEDCSYINKPRSMGASLIRHTDLKPFEFNHRVDIVLVGAPDVSNTENPYGGAQKIREQFYQLNQISTSHRIADFGNLKMGPNINETRFALKEFAALLFQSNVRLIVMGGDKQLTAGLFKAFNEFEPHVNLSIIDATIPISETDQPDPNNYLDPIFVSDREKLFNLSTVGYQSYFVDQKQINCLTNDYFEHYRLGVIRNSIEELEPVMRDSDLVCFNLESVRMVDAPGQKSCSPNGLYTEETCQLSRYAGMSDRLRAFALWGMVPEHDHRHTTAMLSAQIIWYFIEGSIQRKHDFPLTKLSEYNNYIVTIDEIEYPIVFYKSNRSDRWWLEISTYTNLGEIANQLVVSCSERDYLKASRNEIPDRWLTNFKKIE